MHEINKLTYPSKNKDIINSDYEMNIDERITELEIQFTHQDSTISDLNDVIFSQQKTIDNLEDRILKLEGFIKNISLSNVKNTSQETRPPHY